MLPPLRGIPIVNVLSDLILGQAVSLLDLAFQLLTAAIDRVEIVIGELAPFLLHLPLDLLPISFNAIPVHLLAPSEIDHQKRNVEEMNLFQHIDRDAVFDTMLSSIEFHQDRTY
jgi:hypothetical protein